MYKLIVTELAHQDLDKIVSYIAVELVNPIAATNFLDKLINAMDFLNPTHGCMENARTSTWIMKDIDEHPSKFLRVYKIDEEFKTVSVLRFFHGAQDYINLIKFHI